MNTLLPGKTDDPGRTKILGAATLVAVLAHGLALYGVHWAPLSAAQATPREEGVTVDLAQAPAFPIQRRTAAEAAPPVPPAPQEQEIPPVPEPRPEPEPAPRPEPASRPEPIKKRPPQPPTPRGTVPAPGVPNPTPAAATQAAQTRSVPAPDAVRAAAASPEPLATRSNPKPAYPELARKRGQEGLVRLLAHVDEQGKPTEISVAESSGFSLLDEAAVKAVRRWRFKPALRAGTPVRGTVLIPIEFVLKRR